MGDALIVHGRIGITLVKRAQFQSLETILVSRKRTTV